jgi:hypothetical protein
MWVAFWKAVPVWLKIGAAVVLAVVGAYQLGKLSGATGTRAALKMEAIKEASNRITNMENNNADFRKKTARDRCLVLMRDSGLPDSGCD